MTITQTKTNVVQYNEYYPFGLQTQKSWTRSNSTNNYLYNGGAELNSSSGWYDTYYRGFDPALGRFHQIDPVAGQTASLTPYHFAGNNPAVLNDPNGDRLPTPTWITGEDDNDGVGWVAKHSMGSGMEGMVMSFRNSGGWTYGGMGMQATGQIMTSMLVFDSPSDMNIMLGTALANSVLRGDGFGSGAIWNPIGGPQISRAQWEKLSKDTKRENNAGNKYYPGSWVNEDGSEFLDPSFFGVGMDHGLWFEDAEGEFLFDHWRNGNGQALTLNSAQWAAYMRNNSYLRQSIANKLKESYQGKTVGNVSGNFHGETGQSNYSSGYGMLHGTNARVGDLQYSGFAKPNENGSVSYFITLTWHDIMDPNANYILDVIGAEILPGVNYDVHISWQDIITVTPNK